MSDKEQLTTIEINGVKMEVDLRYAKRVDVMKVGTKVKVLKEDYSGPKVYAGVVVGFEPFQKLPTIVVAYVEEDWDKSAIKFLFFNEKAKADKMDIVVAADQDFSVDRNVIMAKFDKQIAAKQREIETIEEQRRYFETNFAAFWLPLEPKAEPEVEAAQAAQ